MAHVIQGLRRGRILIDDQPILQGGEVLVDHEPLHMIPTEIMKGSWAPGGFVILHLDTFVAILPNRALTADSAVVPVALPEQDGGTAQRCLTWILDQAFLTLPRSPPLTLF